VQTAKNAADASASAASMTSFAAFACYCWVGLLPPSVVHARLSVVCERRSSSFAKFLARGPAREPARPIGAASAPAIGTTSRNRIWLGALLYLGQRHKL
jgi:hypothetical protein